MQELAMRIRRGGPDDTEVVRSIAVQVFSHFGDYGRILPTWLVHDGVVTHIAETLGDGPQRKPIGYTMLGFYPARPGERGGPDALVADLLAIAVAPQAQGRGVGKRLLEHALQQVRVAARRLHVVELRLSVAETNTRARTLFAQFGFHLVDGEHGYYDGGQMALHMVHDV
jgi:ribosomal protein S18 acetylase RimI-like enzyme